MPGMNSGVNANGPTVIAACHEFAVNLFVVAALAVTGLAIVTAWRRALLPAVAATMVLCLATCVLVQDFGFFGGVGTDPNTCRDVGTGRAAGRPERVFLGYRDWRCDHASYHPRPSYPGAVAFPASPLRGRCRAGAPFPPFICRHLPEAPVGLAGREQVAAS